MTPYVIPTMEHHHFPACPNQILTAFHPLGQDLFKLARPRYYQIVVKLIFVNTIYDVKLILNMKKRKKVNFSKKINMK